MKTIYLAGKAKGLKWSLVSLDRAAFVATDMHREHGRHGTRLVDLGHGQWDDCAPWEVTSSFLTLLGQSDALVAYVECATAYGTIAEVAHAAAIGKPTYFILNDSSPEANDAYWFVAHLPGVMLLKVNTRREASLLVGTISSFGSPIEEQFWRASDTAYIRDESTVMGMVPFSRRLIGQYPVRNYRLDFAVPERRLAIELDGHAYHSSREDRTKDSARQRALTSDGWTVVRFTGTEIHANARRCAQEAANIAWTLPKKSIAGMDQP